MVDVSKREAVAALAEKAEISGRSSILVHTAGINADQGSVNAILAVNLPGVALLLRSLKEPLLLVEWDCYLQQGWRKSAGPASRLLSGRQ